MKSKAPNLSTQFGPTARASERGAALATSVLLLGMLGAIAITVLAVVGKEAKIAGSDVKRTQTFYAASAGIEKMTTDFNGLFQVTSRPSAAQLIAIQNAWPQELRNEGYVLDQIIGLDSDSLDSMRLTQGIHDESYPRVTIPGGPFNGLSASVAPYILSTQATAADGTQVALTRQMNNYLIPIFQFGMFSNDDIELHPGPPFSFNGRVHANGNIYVNGEVTFLSKVTAANELVYDVLRNGVPRTDANVAVQVGTVRVPLTMGSMFSGPNIVGSSAGQRGYFPGSPDGSVNSSWDSTSIGPASVGVNNQFGGQVQTRTTGGTALVLPLQLTGNSTRELIKRRTPSDPQVVRDSRYHSKAQIRILIDDENPATTDTSGIPAGQGVQLSTFNPIPLPNVSAATGGGRALWRINNSGNYLDTAATCVRQAQSGSPGQALTVRGVRGASQAVNLNGTATTIPAGAGLSGRILIQLVDTNGNVIDVTQPILSLGMTVGEPNAIVTLQRPLWAAFTQGSRDASASQNVAADGTTYFNSLTDIVTRTYIAADGQLNTSPGPTQDAQYGYLTGLVDDIAAGQPNRADVPPSLSITDWGTANWSNNKEWNAIVPINVYNVREGCIDSANCDAVYERGITNVVELNMKNLARWLDGVYDGNLLAGSTAVSGNIANPGGFTVYVSDRRGDRVKTTTDFNNAAVSSSNGMVDNEDVYGADGLLQAGEDVQNTGTLVKDIAELPDPAVLGGAYGADLTMRALTVAAWSNPNNYFRHSLRLFNGENLQISGAADKLSATQGVTVSTENMMYIWGNYNTTGINLAPPDGSASLNELTATYHYLGNQVPSSLISDAFFPLSKTWADNCSAMYPGNLGNRQADRNLPSSSDETAIRAGIISGNNLGALAGSPDAGNTATGESRLNGGIHNFPRFLERWNARWNFAGSLIPLYRSTQAVGPYNADSTIYSPPIRNWAFDTSFLDPNKLPPSTPQFQYVQPTAFRQLL
ncbi:MAG TPA: hypothetical protein VGO68_05460 [Pyrinomonadaceae bacterium]|jgi:hypothetical protein|nr:hypothetical protein [Pyrinomonadaceae bacterium]